ncbi:MAG: Gfo/Idh/MocA family oxidoreductase [Parafilimonas terrae]|nr:Gfo/Idh/MocA family oxidoreductase [Parafilimonas terrae]
MAFPNSLPKPRLTDQAAVPALRWGVVGPGWIAERFVAALKAHTRQEVVAVQSSEPVKARAFAERFGVARSYGGRDMMADPSVDVVYVSTVHTRHFPDALAAIEAGKHVLVEKPLALNADEARRLSEAARVRGVLLMEAYWADFLPKFDVIRQLLADGALGSVRTVIADHGEWFGPEHRIMRADLAGGPMLDLGTYPVALATGILGRPARVLASGEGAPSGVNGQASMLLTHPDGAQSVLHTSLLGHTPGDAIISGTGGMLTIPGRFYTPGPFTLTANDLTTKLVYDEPRTHYAQLFHQAVHLAACLGEGRTESSIRSLADSILTLEVMDEARRQLGIGFAEEKNP